MAILFTGDMHLGHKNAIKYDRRPFSSVEEMDETIIQNWQNETKPNDTIYICGDLSWYNDNKTAEILKNLNGHKILIKGNHDNHLKKSLQYFDDVKDYDEIHLPGNIHINISHYPIKWFNRRHHGAYMFYAHVHNSIEWIKTEEERRALENAGQYCNMFNVGTMHWGYRPVTFEEIIENYPQIIKPVFEACEMSPL